jgi:hypothetical protein
MVKEGRTLGPESKALGHRGYFHTFSLSDFRSCLGLLTLFPFQFLSFDRECLYIWYHILLTIFHFVYKNLFSGFAGLQMIGDFTPG